MGKKYIIDLNPDCVEGEYLRIPARIAGEEQWLVTKAALTPYTEPDLEQVRKDYDAFYEQGLTDAWEAARKIIHMPEGDLLNIFTECYSAVCTALQVLLKYDAAEAIEKLKAYEQEQEEIQVGDEVVAASGKAVVLRVLDVNAYYVYKDATWGFMRCDELVKTGRTFPEIATVLEKMREE